MTGTGAESGATPTDPPSGTDAPATPSTSNHGAQPWPQPQPAWLDHTPPPPDNRLRIFIIFVVILGAALLGLVVCGGIVAVRTNEAATSRPLPELPALRTDGPFGARPTAPSATAEPAQEGPYASDQPATKVDDLDSICDGGAYYPQSPKHAGKAPHPVALFKGDGSGSRYQDSLYYFDLGLSEKVKQTWAPENVKKVQTVACLDRVGGGSTIRRCTFDDPKPDTLTLLRSTWRLRVYEVATGRRLVDKRLPADDKACPYVVLYGPDKKIYATVSDRAVIAALRPFVNKP